MITGVVTPGREPVVTVQAKGAQGQSTNVRAILDTGFTESLSLPENLVLALGLRFVNTDYAVLADGSVIAVALYEATPDDGRGGSRPHDTCATALIRR